MKLRYALAFRLSKLTSWRLQLTKLTNYGNYKSITVDSHQWVTITDTDGSTDMLPFGAVSDKLQLAIGRQMAKDIGGAEGREMNDDIQNFVDEIEALALKAETDLGT